MEQQNGNGRVSWFFRDHGSFDNYRALVLPKLKGKPRKILSVACGTGENTYSAALTSKYGRFPFKVYGIDSDPDKILTAQAGEYVCEGGWDQLLSHRDLLENVSSGESYRVQFRFSDEAKAPTSFEVGDILEGDLERKLEFDVIFCLNFLHTLPLNKKDAVMQRMLSSLKPDGFLVLDTLLVPGASYPATFRGRPLGHR